MLPSCGSDPSPLFLLQIIEWLCDNVNTFSCFDQIQEFILGQFQRPAVPPDTSHLPLPHPLLSLSSPLKNLVTFENLETSRQQPQQQHIFTLHSCPSPSDWFETVNSHKPSHIHVNISISRQFRDDTSVKWSKQNLFCISPGSFLLFPASLSPVRSPTDLPLPPLSGSQRGVGHYRRFQVHHLEARGCSRQQSRRCSQERRQRDLQNKSAKWRSRPADFRL